MADVRVREYGTPCFMVTADWTRYRARLRYLNKIQELVPEFMVPFRDEIFPLWLEFTGPRRNWNRAEAEKMAEGIVVRIGDWTRPYRLFDVTDEAAWQLQSWQDRSRGSLLPLQFEREYQIADTQMCGGYPFYIVGEDLDDRRIPDSIKRIRQENYSTGRDYAAAVNSVNGTKGVWKLSPDHAGLDRRCEMLARYWVLRQTIGEITQRMGLTGDVEVIHGIIESMAKTIQLPLEGDKYFGFAGY